MRLMVALMPAVFLVSRVLGAEPPGPQAKPPAQSRGPGEIKIAWVDFDQLVGECDDGKRALAGLQKFFEERSREGGAMRKEIDTLRNQLNLQQNKLTTEARAELQEQLAAKESSLQRFQQDVQKQIEKQRARLGGMIQQKARPVIEKISKERGLSAVVYLNNLDVWVDKAFLITEEVVKAYNATYAVAPEPAKKP